MERARQRVVHHGRIGHDCSKHQMLRNESRPRRRRKRKIVLHRAPLAVTREELDDGAHAVPTVAMPFNDSWPELGADPLADGAVLARLDPLALAGGRTRCGARDGVGASTIYDCHVDKEVPLAAAELARAGDIGRAVSTLPALCLRRIAGRTKPVGVADAP